MTRGRDSGLPAPDLAFRRELHRRVLRWYRTHGRDLPWRGHDDPYAVMVSEFMLQQTQVARVREHLPRWLERFPGVEALARASRRDVLLAWSGMGYNRRALHLHAAAQAIVREHGGDIPDDPAALLPLPGFGRYTAHAVAGFGHRRRLPMVDVNIRRVLSRLTAPMETVADMLAERDAWRLAADLLPQRAFYDWNQALMDVGAMICTARNPRCDACPAAPLCASMGRMRPAPRKAAASSPRTVKAPGETAAAVRETPRRIYRGQLIELLRGQRTHCATADDLHRRLFGPGGEEERSRLLDICATLQRDGMVRCVQGRRPVQDVRAYVGPLGRLRICLAE